MPEVDAGLRVRAVDPVHVVALLVGDHLQRQLVVVAQEHRPLAGLGDRRGLLHDVHDGEPVLHVDRHEQPRHDGKVKGHVALVAVAEVGGGVLRPLVGLGQQHAAGVVLVHVGAELPEEGVRLRQVLAVGALALVQVGHGVEAHPVHPQVEPEIHGLRHGVPHPGVVVVQVGLVGVEPVPVVGLGHRVPRPVRRLEVLEDDAGVGVALRRVAPHVEVPPPAAPHRPPGPLEPGVLVGGVVDDQLRDHPQAAGVGLPEKGLEVAQRAVVGVDAGVVGDVVAVVLQRRRVERQQPDRRDPEVLQVVEPGGQAAKVADPVAVAVGEGTDVELVDDRVLVPEGIVPPARTTSRRLSMAFAPSPSSVRLTGSTRSRARCGPAGAAAARGQASPPGRAPRSCAPRARGSERPR